MHAHLTGSYPNLSPRRLDGVLDWAQLLSGLGLALFLWAHLLLLGSVLVSPALMDRLAKALEASGAVQIGGPLVFLLFLAHFALALRKIPLHPEDQKTLLGHAALIHHADTWLWVAQAFTGAGLLAMGAFHMWSVLANLPIGALKSAETLQSNRWWLAFYLLLAPLAHTHLGLGLYRIAVKWGLVGRAGRKGLKGAAKLLILVSIGLSLATLSRFWFLRA